jgi:catechol 2,3-dioxygenase-like lactoylglutathione lyase family enzyme
VVRITRVLLETASLDDAAAFYSDVLELPVDRTDTIVSVRVGDGLLEFVQGEPDPAGVHHLAFLVAAETFAEAAAWIRARVPLLTLHGANAADAPGGLPATDHPDEFEGPGAWNSRSVYFDGPDGSILEFIARRNLPSTALREGRFTAADILGISEVGVAADDLAGLADRLARSGGILPFGDTSDTFAPTGAEDGMLILVVPGRRWFPTADRIAVERRTAVHATGGVPGRYELSPVAELVVEA